MNINHSIQDKSPNVISVYHWKESEIQLIYMRYKPVLKGMALVGNWIVKYKN